MAAKIAVLPSAEVDPTADNHQTVVINQVGHSLPTPRRLRGSGQHLESSRWVIAVTYDHNKAGAGRRNGGGRHESS